MNKKEALQAGSVPALIKALRSELTSNLHNIPEAIQSKNGWLCYKVTEITEKDKGLKFDKIPVYPRSGRNRSGIQGSPGDIENLGSFDDAIQAMRRDSSLAGVGFATLPEFGVVALDVDHCVEGGVVRSDALELADNTYAELSPSGSGIRAFWMGASTNSKNNDAGYELFHSKGFVTVTGKALDNLYNLLGGPLPRLESPLREKLEYLSTPAPVVVRSPPGEPTVDDFDSSIPPNDETLSDLRSALLSMSADDRKLWVDLGLAAKTLGDDGFEMWMDWSATSYKFDYDDAVSSWESFNPIATGYKAIFAAAQAGGWINPRSFVASPASDDFGHRAYARTEFGLAERFHDRYGESVMYIQEMAAWYTWNGVLWTKSGGAEIKHRAKETINGLLDELDTAASSEERQALLRFASGCQKSSTTENLLKLAQSDLRLVVPVSELDRDSHLMGVLNGVVDLRSGELFTPNPQLRITIATDTAYDKDARAPIFEQTVSDAFFGNVALTGFFRKLMGYVLLGNPKEDILIIPYGCGSNGKSTIFNAIRAAMGSHAKMAGSETFLAKSDVGANAGAPREDLLRLRGARLVCITEPDEGSELREGFIKSLTGGEPVTVRGLYSTSSIEVTPTFTAVMATNHLPFVKGSDHGIWRRLLPIPFTRNFSTDPTVTLDPGRAEKLAAEAAGILAWLVRGAIDYQREGLDPYPIEVAEARASYKKDMDLLSDWITDCCEEGAAHTSTIGELWLSWQSYAYTNGLIKAVPSSRSLGRRLSSRGLLKVQDSHGVSGRGWVGIRLKKTGL